ncbi:MAG TPA: mitochondrial fission ELM1 family protein [Micavibrio sp.]|nr:mitochondrial fission ELM1 family protein [Micavibrio sp.]
MSVNPKSLQCWIVTEGMAGTENQCLGVAEALGIEADVRRISLRQPWKILSPYLGLEFGASFIPKLAPPWPDLLIASGRKSIGAARYIKRASKGKTFTVQIQDPRIDPKEFDLVAVPEHDPTRGENVIVTAAAPNRITPVRLAKARNDFAPLFAMMPSPHIAVLLGGNSKAHSMSAFGMKRLGVQLAQLDGSLIITASRRTTEEQRDAFLLGLGERPYWHWDGTGENPYMGMLAWADYILVTADSVSMLSDAASTGKPVYMIPMDGGTRRFDKFHENLLNQGAIRKFEGTLERWAYSPLNDSARIAAEIRRLMALR